jgi:hypothetical protein
MRAGFVRSYQQPYATPDGVTHLPKWLTDRLLRQLCDQDRKLLQKLIAEDVVHVRKLKL